MPGYYNKPKADYRGAVKYLRTIYNNEDVAIYDTLRAFRSWEPHLYGRGVYYGKHMKVRQYNWNKWTSLLNDGFDTSGRLFLFLHAGKANGPHFTKNDKLIERNFEQMTIIYAKDESLSLKETTLIYIDEMLKFFPENSSKVDLHLARAKLLCKDSTKIARKHIDLAEGFLSGGSVDFQCD